MMNLWSRTGACLAVALWVSGFAIAPASAQEAQEALRIGLVNHVFDRPSLLEECKSMAAMICQAAPIAVEQAKHAINSGLKTDFETGLDIEFKAYGVTLPTSDRLEGLAAFREKRKPVFRGK